MALQVSILMAGKNGGDPFYLRADSVVHSIMRTNTVIPLPTGEGSSPSRLSIELGQTVEQITVSGIVDTSSNEATRPTKAQLEDVCNTWWARGSVLSALPQLTISSGTYTVLVKNAEFRQEGALEDRWMFVIVFLVRSSV